MSPYVALYFAIENGDLDNDAGLWAIDLDWLQERSTPDVAAHDPPFPVGEDFYGVCEYFNRIIFGEDNPPVIFSAEPMQVNQRMTAQGVSSHIQSQ